VARTQAAATAGRVGTARAEAARECAGAVGVGWVTAAARAAKAGTAAAAAAAARSLFPLPPVIYRGPTPRRPMCQLSFGGNINASA
jgi:hypothetical protein